MQSATRVGENDSKTLTGDTVSAAFVVLAHTDLHTCTELTRALAPWPVFLHVDRPAYVQAKSHVPQFGKHVVFNESPVCVHWGGFSVVDAMMTTLKQAITNTTQAVQHFAFLSGQCYPIRPVSQFVHFLNNSTYDVHCRGFALADGSDALQMGLARVKERHFLDGTIGHIRKRHYRLGEAMRRAIAASSRGVATRPNLTHAAGSQWVSIPRRLATELVQHYESGRFEYLRQSFAPDEMAIHTYVFSSRWAARTRFQQLEPFHDDRIASYANFHWLKPSLHGFADMRDVKAAQDTGAFFIRKVTEATAASIRERYFSTATSPDDQKL